MPSKVPNWLETVSFERIRRDRFALVLQDEDHAAQSLDLIVREIVEELIERKRLSEQKNKERLFEHKDQNPQFAKEVDEMPISWLKSVCYHLILCCLHWEVFDCLKDRLNRFGRMKRGPRVARSVFMVGIMGILAHDSPKSGRSRDRSAPLTTEKERGRMAQDMWLAFRHYVEPAELGMFFRQNRAGLETLVSNDDVLPSHRNQIAQRRAFFGHMSSGIEEHRGG